VNFGFNTLLLLLWELIVKQTTVNHTLKLDSYLTENTSSFRYNNLLFLYVYCERYKEHIKALCDCERYKEHIKALCGQNAEF
jgi:hypothetical protein